MKDCIAAALILLSLLFGVPFLGTEPPEKEKEEAIKSEEYEKAGEIKREQDKFKTELGQTLEFIKYSNGKQKLEIMDLEYYIYISVHLF